MSTMDEFSFQNVPVGDRQWMLWRIAPNGQQAESRYRDESEPIHGMFGLTYANYLVLPRSLLQSMPQDWQRVFCDLLADLDDAFGYLDWPKYRVMAVDSSTGRFKRDPIPHYWRGRTRVPYSHKE